MIGFFSKSSVRKLTAAKGKGCRCDVCERRVWIGEECWKHFFGSVTCVNCLKKKEEYKLKIKQKILGVLLLIFIVKVLCGAYG